LQFVSTLFTLNFYRSFIGEFYRKNWDYFVARNVYSSAQNS